MTRMLNNSVKLKEGDDNLFAAHSNASKTLFGKRQITGVLRYYSGDFRVCLYVCMSVCFL